MTIFRYALLRGLRSPLSLLINCFVPILIMFLRPFWTGGGVSGLGLLAFVTMGGAFLMSMSILSDKTEGTIIRILAAPITMRRYLLENLFSAMMPLLLQVLLISILGYVLHDWSTTLTIAVFLCYTMLTLSSVAMAFAWHCLFKNKESSAGGFGMVLTLAAMLGGAMVPVGILPGILEYAGAIFPVYWMMRGINAVIAYDAFTQAFWLGILAMALFTTAYLLFGGRRRLT